MLNITLGLAMIIFKNIKPSLWIKSIMKNRKQHELMDSKISSHIKNYSTNLKRVTPQPYIENISIDITNHCNLNCYSCDHFSQFAKGGFYELEEFERDIKRLSEITNGVIGGLWLIGGEPLLNKNCCEYFKITRKYFKNSLIAVITNGILLPKQPDSFWEVCRDCNVEIQPTKYPIKIDWDSVIKKCEEFNVKFQFYGGEEEKYSFKTCLNPKGDSDKFVNFINCHRANSCTQFRDGRIYPCAVCSNIEFFNKHFNENLESCELDYVDIHNPNVTYNDILQFLARPIPFCRYCDIEKMTYQPWLRSKKDINEYYSQQ